MNELIYILQHLNLFLILTCIYLDFGVQYEWNTLGSNLKNIPLSKEI